MANASNAGDRRSFLKKSGAVAAGLLAQGAMPAQAEQGRVLGALPDNPRTLTAMPTRNLGKTGYKVGIFSLGGQAALEKANNFDVAVPIIERALDLGVNYFDTSSIYGGPDRWSEQYYGAGDDEAAGRGVPGDEDEGADARGFAADDREVAEADEHGPCGSVAAA